MLRILLNLPVLFRIESHCSGIQCPMFSGFHSFLEQNIYACVLHIMGERTNFKEIL